LARRVLGLWIEYRYGITPSELLLPGHLALRPGAADGTFPFALEHNRQSGWACPSGDGQVGWRDGLKFGQRAQYVGHGEARFKSKRKGTLLRAAGYRKHRQHTLVTLTVGFTVLTVGSAGACSRRGVHGANGIAGASLGFLSVMWTESTEATRRAGNHRRWRGRGRRTFAMRGLMSDCVVTGGDGAYSTGGPGLVIDELLSPAVPTQGDARSFRRQLAIRVAGTKMRDMVLLTSGRGRLRVDTLQRATRRDSMAGRKGRRSTRPKRLPRLGETAGGRIYTRIEHLLYTADGRRGDPATP